MKTTSKDDKAVPVVNGGASTQGSGMRDMSVIAFIVVGFVAMICIIVMAVL